LTAGTRRNGTSKVGPFKRVIASHRAQPGAGAPDEHELGLTGRQGSPRGKTARFRVGKVVPAAAVAATLAAGAAAFTLASGGGGAPQASQLNAALGVHPSTAGAGIGQANGAASPIGGASTATAEPRARHAKEATRPTPSTTRPTPRATPTRTVSSPSAAAAPSTAPAAATRSPSSSASASTSKPAATTLSCNLSTGMLPDNVTAIVSFLLAHGYSHNAAAGIAGNMYQESKGNPESEGMGGGGLIGWTPLPSGFVTGNLAADLNTQLAALLTYNQGWASYLPALNAAASPASAADIYVTDFERAGIPAASTREASAQAVATACGL
jgi:Phage tail lysozyme